MILSLQSCPPHQLVTCQGENVQASVDTCQGKLVQTASEDAIVNINDMHHVCSELEKCAYLSFVFYSWTSPNWHKMHHECMMMSCRVMRE